ncbi:hypothetical protein QBC36DRAFT_14644 [Triangularia setosa]|uniref:Uncharacterized protein n=1 Tax=Triangularia setosa TaxID=2587417 RepID=A0AAN7A887_9PEZI|nr:hypothetical protein QBC36DRAFT_14644 [Podospora setosa]
MVVALLGGSVVVSCLVFSIPRPFLLLTWSGWGSLLLFLIFLCTYVLVQHHTSLPIN